MSPKAPRAAPFLALGALLLLALVAVAVRALRGSADPSMARVHADFALLQDALERYRAAGKPLPEEGALDFLVPGFLPAVPADPWGRPYVYSFNGRRLFLATFGQDGVRGGTRADQDHTGDDGHQALGR